MGPARRRSTDTVDRGAYGAEPAVHLSGIATLGKTTAEALQSGLLYGFDCQVDSLVRRISRELGEQPVVLATGDLSHLMFTVCETLDQHEPDLTLVGLRLVYERTT